MNWEDRFSMMVKESSEKIDQAKRRLHKFDTSRWNSLKNVGSYQASLATGIKNSPQANRDFVEITENINRANIQCDALLSSHGSASLTLVNTLCEKVERQSKTCEYLKAKVEALETEISGQQKEMETFKEKLSQICQKVDRYDPIMDGQTLEEWKTEIKSEINKIGARLIHKRDDDDGDDLLERKSAAYERNELLVAGKNELITNYLDEIKNRLDIIETEVSRSHRKAESNSKMAEKNVMLLTDWKNTNAESLTRLCKLQDLSVDEVKHLRSTLYSVQDKVHELEIAINGVGLRNKLSEDGRRPSDNIFEGNNSLMLENPNPTRFYHNSISSDDEEQTSLTSSSLNLDENDNGDLSLEIDELSLNPRTRYQQRPQSTGSDSIDSSQDTHSVSDNSLTEI